MTPPEKLRTELARLRERGYTFTQVWIAAQSKALADEPAVSAVFWRGTWSSQRIVWELSFSKTRWPATEQLPAIIEFENDRSVPAECRAPLPAAA